MSLQILFAFRGLFDNAEGSYLANVVLHTTLGGS